GGLELGALPGPVTLALETPGDLMCGRVVWTGTKVVNAKNPARRATRKLAAGPLVSCATIDDADRTAPQVTITAPSGFDGVSVGTPTISLSGLAIDDTAVVGLTWSNDRGGGATLAPAKEWSADVALEPGDNRITVTATDPNGNVGTDVLDVTYNTNGLLFDGVPVAEPAGLFVGQGDQVVVRESIVANPDLDPASVKVVRVLDHGNTQNLASMADDGNLDAGDEIQGDAIYTAKTSLRSAEPSLLHLRVSARTLSQPDAIAWSPVLTVPVVEHVSQEQLDDMIALANDARDLLARLKGEGVALHDA